MVLTPIRRYPEGGVMMHIQVSLERVCWNDTPHTTSNRNECFALPLVTGAHVWWLRRRACMGCIGRVTTVA